MLRSGTVQNYLKGTRLDYWMNKWYQNKWSDARPYVLYDLALAMTLQNRTLAGNFTGFFVNNIITS